MKKISIIVLIIALVTSSIGLVYGEETLTDEIINVNEENDMQNLDEQSILIASQDEETGETIYSEITVEDLGIEELSSNGTALASSMDNSGVSTLGIIGNDNRTQITNTTQSPYAAICYIEAGFDSNNDGVADDHIRGSGSLIGPNTVATAAHVIYSDEHDVWASYVRVYPGKNGSSNPYGYTTASTKIISGYWNSTYNFPSYGDWGLIELSSPMGNTCGYLGLSAGVSTNLSVNVTGYPADKSTITMWKAPGKLTKIEDNYLYHDCDMVPGSSGSPIYNSYNQLVGINTCEYYIKETGEYTENAGPRLTTSLFQYFNSACQQYGKSSPGHLDSVTTSNIGGWAIDSSSPYTQKDVHVYVRNNSTNELVKSGSVKASTYRSDVGLHGFNYSISWLKIKPATYRVDAYAIGINGSNPALRNSGILYTVEPSGGTVDSVTASGGVRGWVWKPDAPNDSIEAHIYIYDASGNKVLGKAVKASNFRQDLVNAGKGNGYHGFTYSVDWDSLPSGNLTVKVYAVDGSGTNPQIYSKTYNNN